jgi:hypothetical protein
MSTEIPFLSHKPADMILDFRCSKKLSRLFALPESKDCYPVERAIPEWDSRHLTRFSQTEFCDPPDS